jgi:hypothetical protein
MAPSLYRRRVPCPFGIITFNTIVFQRNRAQIMVEKRCNPVTPNFIDEIWDEPEAGPFEGLL